MGDDRTTHDRHGVRADLSVDVSQLVRRLCRDLRGAIGANGRVDIAAVAVIWEAFGREISALYYRSSGARVNVVFRLYLHAGGRNVGFVFRLAANRNQPPSPVEAALMGYNSRRPHNAIAAPSGQQQLPATMIVYPRRRPAVSIQQQQHQQQQQQPSPPSR